MTEENTDADQESEWTVSEERPYPKTNGAGDGAATGAAAAPLDAITRLDEWLTRDLSQPDFICGSWLTTTSRVLFAAPTGLGKTMFGVGLSIAMADGAGFLAWAGRRKCRGLYVDGEMSRRLMKGRLVEEVHRSGLVPPDMHILSHEDIPNFQPLSTEEGQKQIEAVIADRGPFDFITFDNIMSLIGGDMKEEESWRKTVPWQHSLTRRNTAQLWLHHMGHDETRAYGTKTREWQMDTVILAESVKRDDTDVSFKLMFTKARERTPATRADFVDRNIWLVGDSWHSDDPSVTKGKLTPKETAFFRALRDAAIGNEANQMFGRPAASLDLWRRYCVRAGLLQGGEPAITDEASNVVPIRGDKTEFKKATSLFHKYKVDLIAKNWIACNDTMAWIL